MKRSKGGVDPRSDFSGLGLSDSDIAARLQAEEYNPGVGFIAAADRVPDMNDLRLHESQAQTRNADIMRRKAEDELIKYKSQPALTNVYKINYDIDPSYDRLYRWSMGLLPDYSYERKLRMQHLLENLIRNKLYSNEPEYLLKDEIKRLFAEEARRDKPARPATRKPARSAKRNSKSSKKAKPLKKKASKKQSRNRAV